MENEYSVSGHSRKMVENYFWLIRNLSYKEKIELIARISNSLLRNIKEETEAKTKEEILAETYGCFESEKSADEIIEEIYSSRNFTDKSYRL